MSNAEKIALDIFRNGRNTTKGSAVSKHLIRKGVESIESHTNKILQELKEKVMELDKDDQFDGMVVWKEDIITLIDEAINE